MRCVLSDDRGATVPCGDGERRRRRPEFRPRYPSRLRFHFQHDRARCARIDAIRPLATSPQIPGDGKKELNRGEKSTATCASTTELLVLLDGIQGPDRRTMHVLSTLAALLLPMAASKSAGGPFSNRRASVARSAAQSFAPQMQSPF